MSERAEKVLQHVEGALHRRGMPSMLAIKVTALIAAMVCFGCTSNTALQQKCSEGDQVACDQVMRAQQGAGSHPDLSRSPVIAPMVQHL